MITNPFTHRALALMLATTLLLPSARGGAAMETNEIKSLVSGNIDFNFMVYQQINGDSGNLFFSPHSLSTCLAMTYAGARGETQKQMAKTLGFGANEGQIHNLFGRLQNQLKESQKDGGPQLALANALWAQKERDLLPAFKDIVRQQYGAELRQVDFRTGGEKLRKEINAWAEEKTGSRIKDLMPSGKPDESARLVLVNAVYFKGRWARQFAASNTIEAPFWAGTNGNVPSQLMHVTGNFKYSEVPGLQTLVLPYAGGSLSMVVLLPMTNNNALALMETVLGDGTLNLWMGATKDQKMEVFLPKFSITASHNMTKALAKSPMQPAFSPDADFSGIDGGRDLFLSAIVHKAFIEVNEEGTEAAAATGATMSVTSAPAETPVFRADHPFIFVIRDNRSGEMLFVGRLSDPTK